MSITFFGYISYETLFFGYSSNRLNLELNLFKGRVKISRRRAHVYANACNGFGETLIFDQLQYSFFTQTSCEEEKC